MIDELRVHRDRIDDLLDRDAATPVDEDGAEEVGRTFAEASYPTAPGAYYSFRLCSLGGTPIEGNAGTVTPGATVVRALNLGTAVPPEGTDHILTNTRGSWAFRYDG